MNSKVPHVYQAIAAVTLALSKDGIGKNQKNAQQGYKFRGIDDVYNELSPILAANKLCMLPRALGRQVVERQTKSGGVLFYVTLEVEFDLVSAEDGSIHVIRTYGEAMDSADKATNKAMAAAYKYAAMQAFCIPTTGDNDADATTHEIVAGTVDAEQVKTLQAAVMEVDADLAKFLKYLKITRLEDLPAARYRDAIAALEAKRQPREAAA